MSVIYQGKRIKAMLNGRAVDFKTVFMPESSLPEEPVTPEETTVLYVSLGDSISAGHSIDDKWETNYGERSQFSYNGRSEPTEIVEGCYTDLIRDDMVATNGNKKVSAVSFARSGDKVKDLIEKLSNSIVVDELVKANIVTICIGANDVLQDAMNSLETYINTGDLSSIQSTIDANMSVLNDNSNSNSYMSLLNKLTDINPNAKYTFTTVYNPYKYLHLETGQNGFFKPLLDTIPQMNIDVDKIIEDMFLGGTDLSYYDITKLQWVSIELDLDLDGYIKDNLLSTSAVQMLFDRVNRISSFTEGCVNQLNTILKNKVLAMKASYPKFGIAETKALFDTYPDRPTSASVHYNDLVHVAFTRGYNTAVMDWGALWRDKYGETVAGCTQYWTDLAWKYLTFTNAVPSLNVWDYVRFDMNGFATDLTQQVIDKVIVPNVDPHPTAVGQAVLKQSFTSEV